MYKLIRETETAKYSGLDDLSFLSHENIEIIEEFEKLPDINKLFNKYDLIDYEQLTELVSENKTVELETYQLIINNTYNVVGYRVI